MGLVQCPLVVADEPGAWEINGGGLVHDAIQTAMGKPNSPLRAVYIGTLAPMAVEGHWYHDMVSAGTGGSRYVQAIQGDAKRWDQWAEIRRCNPLTAVSGEFRQKLIEERDEARRDSRLKARFLSYRLNLPSGDESTVLLTIDDWERSAARPVPPRQGLPVLGVDLGGGRSWSAAVAMWASGRTEAIACAPGIPDLTVQEKRDLVPKGLYTQLAESGVLRVAGRFTSPAAGATVGGGLRAMGRGARHRVRPLPIAGPVRRDRRTGSADPPGNAVVRIERGYPGAAQGRERWAVVDISGESRPDRGIAGCLSGQDRRRGQLPADQTRLKQRSSR